MRMGTQTVRTKTMNMQRFSLRTSLVITIVAMGVLALALVVLSGSVYRNLAVDQQRAAVAQMIQQQAETLLADLRRESTRLATSIQQEPAFRRSLASSDSVAITKQLTRELEVLATDTSNVAAIRLLAFDRQLELVGESSLDRPRRSIDGFGCREVLERVRSRSDGGHINSASGFCGTGMHPYYAIVVPVVHEKMAGYLQVISDPIRQLSALETIFNMPVRLASTRATLFQSRTWPESDHADRFLLAEYTQELPGTSQTVAIAVAKDLTSFSEKLLNTRYLLIVAAVFITLTAVVIALMVLQHTALNPLQTLTEQLRRLRQDKRHLGQRVEIGGNTEVSELAAGFNDMTTRLKELYESLEHMAFTDHLTGLPNRMLFHDRLQQAILGARRDKKPFALFIMDLDHFKDVNDTVGHHVGDVILQQVGQRLRDKLRKSDTVARMGGDEFAVLLVTVGEQHAEMAARMLLKALRAPFVVEGQSFEIGASIGIALYPDHGSDVNMLTQHADVAMYAAKNNNSGFAFYSSELNQHMPNRLALMGELRRAVDCEEFVVYYQPTVALHTGQLTGMEALTRWKHPEKDIVLPDTFIPLMEQSGLIRSLTPWVLNAALQDCHEWHKDGFDVSVSVNLSTRDLQDPYIVDTLSDVIAACDGKPDWLELEITESAVMIDPVRAMEALGHIAEMGIRLSIDDFGTGYSSLGYLKKLPVSVLKIDKSFVIGMKDDENDATIVRSSVDLAHNMGLTVVAEGVENADTFSLLTELGCDAAQGIFISQPMPAAKVRSWLRGSPWSPGLRN